MSASKIYSWASGRSTDEIIEASIDGKEWFVVEDGYRNDNFYYRVKGENCETYPIQGKYSE